MHWFLLSVTRTILNREKQIKFYNTAYKPCYFSLIKNNNQTAIFYLNHKKAYPFYLQVKDDLEIKVIAEVLGEKRTDKPLPVGCVKTNIGSAEAVSGWHLPVDVWPELRSRRCCGYGVCRFSSLWEDTQDIT